MDLNNIDARFFNPEHRILLSFGVHGRPGEWTEYAWKRTAHALRCKLAEIEKSVRWVEVWASKCKKLVPDMPNQYEMILTRHGCPPPTRGTIPVVVFPHDVVKPEPKIRKRPPGQRSVFLDEEATKKLDDLRGRPIGFNFNRAVNGWIKARWAVEFSCGRHK